MTPKWEHETTVDAPGDVAWPEGFDPDGLQPGDKLPTDVTRDGYTFDGWVDEDGHPITSVPTYGGTVTPVFTPNERGGVDDIVGSLDDGTLSDEDQQKTYKVGDTLPTPTKDGYAFDGWYDEQGNKVDTVPADGKVSAKWSLKALTRLSGGGRYDTMGELVSEAYPDTADTVIVASGENYPDALAASGLSGVLDAPIVLTGTDELSAQAAEQLDRLQPSTIIIAGGGAAVSDTVKARLADYGRVERLSGSSRYETSYLLYERGGDGWGTTAIVATGAGYADALSVSSYAYAGKAPVFLCDPATGLTDQQKTALGSFERVIVVGGSAAVPDEYVSGLPGVERLSGAGRYETSVKLAEWTAQNGLGMDGVVYATGENFPDALVSGPLAGRNNAPVLLVGAPDSATVSYSAQAKGQVSKAYVAGGEGAVGADTMTALADALGITKQ